MPKTFIRQLFSDEEKFVSEGAQTKYPVIAVSGSSGCGKGTYIEALKFSLKRDYRLDLPVTSAGEPFEKVALKYGYPKDRLHEFSNFCQKNPEIGRQVDLDVDRGMLEAVIKKGGIFDGRLAIAVVGDWGLRTAIYTTDLRVIAERIKANPKRRENRGAPKSIEQIMEEIKKRDEADLQRYKEYYGIEDYLAYLREHAIVMTDNTPEITFHDGKTFMEDFMGSKKWQDFYQGTTAWLQANGFI